MFDDDADESFANTLRSIASELGQYIERSLDEVDVGEVADSVGVDPVVAREWAESAGSWLREHFESLGAGLADQVRRSEQAGAPGDPLRGLAKRSGQADAPGDPLDDLAPHPLDLPTDEQGLALAALDSGRWIVEPGTDALAAKGEGPPPADALGLVRELRVRDWITAEGKLTLVGQHALERWLDAAGSK